MARAIATLEGLGYIERHIDVADRRAYKVYLTAKGRAIEPKIQQGLKQWSDEITRGFTPEEKQQAYDLSKRMAKNALELRETLNTQAKQCEVK